jgi:hypothetical protein
MSRPRFAAVPTGRRLNNDLTPQKSDRQFKPFVYLNFPVAMHRSIHAAASWVPAERRTARKHCPEQALEKATSGSSQKKSPAFQRGLLSSPVRLAVLTGHLLSLTIGVRFLTAEILLLLTRLLATTLLLLAGLLSAALLLTALTGTGIVRLRVRVVRLVRVGHQCLSSRLKTRVNALSR